jgi:16S rRNA (cytosine1402-N4)-methyltransferase
MAHIPVLLDETLHALMPDGRAPQRVIDGTLGAGGHTRALLERGAGHVLGLDLDPQAIGIASHTLADFSARVTIVHDSYAHMAAHAAALGWQEGVDAILLDLGVSSMQLDTAERGFAFSLEGALDMRFDPSSGEQTAADIVNTWDAAALADLFYEYGEERDSRRLAQAIVKARPHHSTRQLADVIKAAARIEKRTNPRAKPIHPATRIFQALRIAVNRELDVVTQAIPAAIALLRPQGRLAVISFHSLEDRIVKQTFKDAAEEIISPPGMQLQEKRASVTLVTRKPITATDAEIGQNPRSRSAKLRVVEKR